MKNNTCTTRDQQFLITTCMAAFKLI